MLVYKHPLAMQTLSYLPSSGPVQGPMQELDALICVIIAQYGKITSSVKSALDNFRETVKHAVAIWLCILNFHGSFIRQRCSWPMAKRPACPTTS